MKIFLVGMMGSGKTSAGKKLAKLLSYQFIDVDEYIKEKEGKSISDIFNELGEDIFRKLEHQNLLNLLHLKDAVISTGGGLPIYHGNMELMNKHGKSIYLQAEPAFLRSRLINQKENRPLISSLKNEEIEPFLANMLKMREHYYGKAHFTIASKSLNVNDLKDKLELNKLLD